jgi:hypothetical protein
LEDAKKFASETAAKVARSSLSSIETNADARQQLARLRVWQEQSALVGKTLHDVGEFGLSHYRGEQRKKVSPFVSELLTLWVDDRATGFNKKLRPRTVKGIRSAANLMKLHFADLRVAQIDGGRIEAWIKANGVSRQTAKNRRAYAQQFFHWVIPKYWQGANPTAATESIHVERETPKFYRPEARS